MALNLGTVPNLEKIAIPQSNAQFTNIDGLQEAHIYGKEFTSRALGKLLDLIDPNHRTNPNSSQSNPDSKANGFLAPETSAGGMATGVAVIGANGAVIAAVVNNKPNMMGDASRDIYNLRRAA